MSRLSWKRPRQDRSRSQAILGAEGLESRTLMTGGVGNTFAMLPGLVAEPGGAAEVRFSLGPEHFTRPNGRIILGIDVAPDFDSTLNPMIQSVQPAPTPETAGLSQAARFAGPRATISRSPLSAAVLATIQDPQGRADATQDYVVRLSGRNQTSGPAVVGFYLPGDVNGDGVVDNTDLQLVRSLIGTNINHSAYQFDADANRDGRIDRTDLMLTLWNRGAATTISPVLSANLDPASDTGEADRITTLDVARFDGVASPGASIRYRDVEGRVPEAHTVADPTGYYQLHVGLAPGLNTFHVSATDAFGQTISGRISPVART